MINEKDCKILSDNQFSRPTGKSFPNVKNMDLCEFEPFCNVPLFNDLFAEFVEDLSVDQKYLYKVMISLIQGKMKNDLVNTKIGPRCHSGWLTTVSRICRLYAAALQSSSRLRTIIIRYIFQISTPMWFMVKRNDKATDDTKNLFFLVKSSEEIQCPEAKNIMQRIIQRNAFFAHTENIFLVMLSDSDKAIIIISSSTIISLLPEIPTEWSSKNQGANQSQ